MLHNDPIPDIATTGMSENEHAVRVRDVLTALLEEARDA